MAAIHLLNLPLSPLFTTATTPRLHLRRPRRRNPNFTAIKSTINLNSPTETKPATETSFLLEVSGMMCGACVSRVKKILSADERVESAVVNMLTETAAIRLRPGVEGSVGVAEAVAGRLTECGYEARRRVGGKGVGERVGKWKETVARKRKGVEESRRRVAVAWGLVALCCGSHGGHLLHSVGIHVAHGTRFILSLVLFYWILLC